MRDKSLPLSTAYRARVAASVLTLEEAAARVGVTVKTIRRRIDEGSLTPLRPELGPVLFFAADLENGLSARKRGPKPK